MPLRDFFVPDEWHPSVYHIDLERLARRGVRGIVLDLDNTLVAWGADDPPEELRAWVRRVLSLGMRACIVSNNSSARVQSFAAALGVPGIPKAVKPRRAAFRRAMAVMGTGPAETVVVGDQVFTDVFGAKRLGLYTILVEPVARREFLGTQLVRRLEGLWLRRLRRRGLIGP